MNFRIRRNLLIVVVFMFLIVYVLYKNFFISFKLELKTEHKDEFNFREDVQSTITPRIKVVLAVVACGARINETLTMIKSALMFTKSELEVIIVTENSFIFDFNVTLTLWKSIVKIPFSFKLLRLTFPKPNAEEWQKLFKPCASQRLFLPSVLDDVDSILYVDTDTLFLSPPEEVWKYFFKMNSSQMSALAPEHEDPNVGWYNRFARHPYYGKMGVNSGVMLMNLTRMREFQWGSYLGPIYKKYKLKITWGDQDIINIIFHYHPDKLLIYPCRFNFRPDHCMYMSICKSAEKNGISVLHGSRSFFHTDKQPVFKTIYDSFEKFQIGFSRENEFYRSLSQNLNATMDTTCGLIKDVFLRSVKQNLPEISIN